MDDLKPKDHAEAVAIFRHAVIGPLCARTLSRGELSEALRTLSGQRFRPPDSDTTRTYSVPTLERWYYSYSRGGLDALRPNGRRDRGRGRHLNPALRELILDIRREHPAASARLIVSTLEADGRLEPGRVKPATVRKMLRQAGLDRIAVRAESGPTTRLRWQASAPNALWHGDVCHGPSLLVAGIRTPIRIHGLLDDCSRYVIALEAHTKEREQEMLRVLIRALRLYGKPDTLYLDNGSTYRGDVLRTACARLGISLIHARPYDPQARGKMERFWRTLREGCLDHLGEVGSLEELNRRLKAFLSRHYHDAAHAGLMGRCPNAVYTPSEQVANRVDDAALREALSVREKRRVRRDTTVSVDGSLYELEQGFLAGRIVDVVYSYLDHPLRPQVEYEARRYALNRVDATKNARRARPPRGQISNHKDVEFDPAALTAPADDKEDLHEIF